MSERQRAIVDAGMKHYDAIFDWAGPKVRRLVIDAHPDRQETYVLDVGAGQGKYRVLLADYPNVDGVEVWESSVSQNNLDLIYRTIQVADVVDLVDEGQLPDWYDVMILGDVLEHLTVERAQSTLRGLYELCDDVIVVVPYEYPQDEEDGNLYQIHRQDDLTVELMVQRYPELTLVAVQVDHNGKPFKGIYRRRQ